MEADPREAWAGYFTDNGLKYYYNTATEESAWDLPPGIIEVRSHHSHGDRAVDALPHQRFARDCRTSTRTAPLVRSSVPEQKQGRSWPQPK